jgi:hypothetical protein
MKVMKNKGASASKLTLTQDRGKRTLIGIISMIYIHNALSGYVIEKSHTKSNVRAQFP